MSSASKSVSHRKNQIVFCAIEMTVPPRDIIEFAAVVLDKVVPLTLTHSRLLVMDGDVAFLYV
jgi:hypothetical protein